MAVTPTGKFLKDIQFGLHGVFKCLNCSQETPQAMTFQCPSCSGAMELSYPNISNAEFIGTGMNRYKDLLPLGNYIYPDAHSTLQKLVDLPGVFAKNDGDLPTGNTKFRQASIAVPAFWAGGINEIVVASTGNSSNSYCYEAQLHPGHLGVHVFVPKTHQGRIRFLNPYVDLHVTDSDFMETGNTAKAYAKRHNLSTDGGFYNPYRREGLKTAYLEAIEQFVAQNGSSPDYFIQAISSGMGVIAAHSAFRQALQLGWIDRIPAMIVVQQETCAPMVKADRDNRPAISENDIERNPEGLAAAILRGNPTVSYPYVRKVVKTTGGRFVSVSADELRASKATLADQKIRACFAAAATHSAAYQLREELKGKSGVIMITGSKD